MRILIFSAICLFFSVNGQRISGGSQASIDQYPFAAALLSNSGQGTFVQACGGTILTATAILSAASCFYTNNDLQPVNWWRVRVGSSNSNGGGTVHLINRITVRSDFSSTTLVNDLAILRPSVPIYLVAGRVEAARISGSAYTFNNNQAVWAIGWGATSAANPTIFSSVLQHVEIFVVDQQTCTNRHAAENFVVTNNMVCVGWLDVGVRGQCEGDKGSPLVDNGIVVGVHSWSNGCAQSWFPSINTRVQPYLTWIIDTALTP